MHRIQHNLLILILVIFIVLLVLSAIATLALVLSGSADNLPDTIKSINCTESATTASGYYAPLGPFCTEELIFEDNFDILDYRKWKNEKSLGDVFQHEFQWYTDDHENSYVKNSILHIKPTLTSDYLGVDGEERLAYETIKIPSDECTRDQFGKCEITGTPQIYVNPIRSAHLQSVDSFSFKYGRIEISAKLPTGDWLWPSIRLMPKQNVYGQWPRSGNVNIMNAQGNLELSGKFVGSQKSSSSLCYGPHRKSDGCWASYFSHIYLEGFKDKFRRYQLEWSPKQVKFSIDNEEVGVVRVGDGFWRHGYFGADGAKNPWVNGTLMAPFDEEFYLSISLAVGGTSGYFPDSLNKPWMDKSDTAAKDFWDARDAWYPTWKPFSRSSSSSFLIDYVRVWAI